MNLSAFRSPEFRMYFAGNAFALQGLWIQRITIAWLAWDLTGSPGYVGWIAFLGFAPTIFVGPIFGVLVDRSPVRKAAMMSQGALACLSLAMALFFHFGILDQTALMALALGIGIVTAANHPVRLSLGPLLAPRESIPSVISATSINFNLARTVGPAVGGFIISQYGVGAALWVVVAFSIPFQIILLFLSPRARALSSPERLSVLAGLLEGFHYAWRSGFMRAVLMITGLTALICRGLLEVMPLVADGVFGRGAAGLGTLASSAGVGALAAAGIVTILPIARDHEVPSAGRVAAVLGVAMCVVVALSPSWPLTILAVAVLGGCSTVLGVTMQSALQQVLPDDYRGRVMSFWVMTGIGGSAVGALAIGALTELMGLGAAVLAFGGVIALLMILAPRLTR